MLKKTLILFAGNAIAALAGIVSLHQMASVLSKSEYGAYAYLLGIFGMCFCLTDFGLGAAHVKAIADGREVRTCFRTYLTLELCLLSLTAVVLTAIVLPQYSAMVSAPRSQARETYLLLLASWSATLISTSICYTFSGLLQPVRQVVPSLVRSVALVALLAAVRTAHSFKDVCLASVVSSSLGLVTALYLARGLYGARFCMETARSYWLYAKRLAPGLFTGSIGKNLDTVLVGRLVSLTELAPYFASKRFLTPLDQLASSIDYVLFPTLATHIAANRPEEARLTFLRTERTVLSLASLIAASAVFFAQPILSVILGRGYVSFTPWFGPMMCAGCALYLLAIPYMSVFNALGYPQTTSSLNVIGSGLLILSNVIFIPSKLLGLPAFGWGVAGAVMSLVLPAGFLAISARIRVRRVLGAGFEFSHLICLASAFGFASLFARALTFSGEPNLRNLGIALLLTSLAHALTVLKFGHVSLPAWRRAVTRERIAIPAAEEEALTR